MHSARTRISSRTGSRGKAYEEEEQRNRETEEQRNRGKRGSNRVVKK